mmetsp:Transcript_56095/g.64008  ORF Transcript_56095/g.64008 Transcript_56095/m.64008 type:complete len:93 (+) Transcript_56095:194-472(+)
MGRRKFLREKLTTKISQLSPNSSVNGGHEKWNMCRVGISPHFWFSFSCRFGSFVLTGVSVVGDWYGQRAELEETGNCNGSLSFRFWNIWCWF